MEPESLLEHKDFVRTLARQLVLDEQSADDVTQQTWLAALEHPPRTTKSIRNWLAKITRNIALTTRRVDRSRGQREKATAKCEVIPSAAESYERAVTRRRIIDEVLTLDEPYRYAILLRFYEELTPRQIASHLNLPIETVRTRLKRGLAKLRQKLDREFGDRGAWCLALAPLAGLKVGVKAATAGVAASTVSTVSGGILMATKVKVGIAVVVVLCAAVVLWQAFPKLSEEGISTPSVSDTEAFVAEAEESNEEQSDNLTKVRVEPSGVLFSGKVIDESSRKPITDFGVTISRSDMSNSGFDSYTITTLIQERIEDEEGRFSFRLDSGGERILHVAARGYLDYEDNEIYISPNKGLRELCIELNAGGSVRGRVVENDTGKPVEGALVLQEDKNHGIHVGIDESRQSVVKTDSEGRFSLTGLKQSPKVTRIVAAHPSFSLGWAEAEDGDENLEIRLNEGIYIFGSVRDNQDEPISGVKIHAVGKSNFISRPVFTDTDGRFQTLALHPGEVWITATVRSGKENWWEDEEAAGFTRETKRIELSTDDVEVNFGPSTEYLTWKGVLYDATGKPSAGTTILISEGINSNPFAVSQITGVTSDDEGRFTFHKLRPGYFLVNFRFPTESAETKLETITLDTPGIVKRDLFIPGGCIRGCVVNERAEPVPGGVIYARREWDAESSREGLGNLQCNISKKGEFKLIGLRPGKYTLLYFGGYRGKYNYPNKLDSPWQDVSYDVVEGKTLDGVRFIVPDRGILRIRGTGFQDSDKGCLQAELRHQAKSMRGGRITVKNLFDRRGDLHYSAAAKVGTWELRLIHNNGATVERVVQIVKNQVSEVLVDRDGFGPFSPGPDPLIIEGILERIGGTPVPDCRLCFWRSHGKGGRKEKIHCTTGVQGDFGCNLFPGTWHISVEGVADNAGGRCYNSVVLPTIEVPAIAGNPHSIRLLLPSGRVTCKIDSTSFERNFERRTLSWSAFLLDEETGREVASAYTVTGTKTELDNIPPGVYRLRIEVSVCLPWVSKSFEVCDGETSDLGSFAPIVAGLLDLEVVDGEGRSVNQVVHIIATGNFTGHVLYPYRTRSGRVECPFPADSAATAVVRVEGFKDVPILVDLEPNEVEEIRVVLEID